MIDNLVGLCREDTAEIQLYMHVDFIEQFIIWLNENHQIHDDCSRLRWKTVPMDAAAVLAVKESDNCYPLLVDRHKIGYANSQERQLFYQNVLKQVFPPWSLSS